MRTENAFDETTFSFSSKAPEPNERRRDPRHLTILRVGTLIVDERRELCLIRNISAGGLMAHAYSRFTQNQRVSIELKSNQPTPGYISWISGSNIGLQFDEQIDVEDMLASQTILENGWRPRLPRVEVDRMATLRMGAVTHWVATRDISQGGIKVESEHPLDVGADVVLTIDKLRTVLGVVRWCHGGQAGISFNQVIPFRELMDWLRAE